MSGDVTSLPDSSPLWDPHKRPDGPLDLDADTGEEGEPADLAAAAARLLRQARPLHE